MKYELGDHSVVKCPELGLVADIDFKTKGWVSGCYNAIGGTIKDEHTGEILYELSGLWSDEMFIKDMKVGSYLFPDCLCIRPLQLPDKIYSNFDNLRLDTRRCFSMLTGLSHPLL